LCQAGCYLDRLWRPGVAQLVDPDTEVEAAVKSFMAAWAPEKT
jgi:hypothetical protein